MKEQLQDAVIQADKILIGIGNEFQEKYTGLQDETFKRIEKENPLLAAYQKISFLQDHEDEHIIQAYNNLYELVKEKDFFILSTCTDDRIYHTNLPADKIVTPCGGFRFLQCSENCSDELLPVTSKMIKEKELVLCPHCGKTVCFNQINAPVYNENGYMEQWSVYRKWLQGTINRKLCIVELGVLMDFPSVIRWPFEKIATYNQKSSFFRINETLYQLPKEISNNGNAKKENAVTFLEKQF